MTARFCRPVKTLSQNFDPSVSASHILVTFQMDAHSEINGLVGDTLVLADFQHHTVQLDDGIQPIQWTGLPVDNRVDHGICDFRNQPD